MNNQFGLPFILGMALTSYEIWGSFVGSDSFLPLQWYFGVDTITSFFNENFGWLNFSTNLYFGLGDDPFMLEARQQNPSCLVLELHWDQWWAPSNMKLEQNRLNTNLSTKLQQSLHQKICSLLHQEVDSTILSCSLLFCILSSSICASVYWLSIVLLHSLSTPPPSVWES